MKLQMTDATLGRVNHAIQQTRLLAALVRAALREDARERGEGVVDVLNIFRMYVRANLTVRDPLDRDTIFKHDIITLGKIEKANSLITTIYLDMTKTNQRKHKEAYGHVTHILQDMRLHVKYYLERPGHNA